MIITPDSLHDRADKITSRACIRSQKLLTSQQCPCFYKSFCLLCEPPRTFRSSGTTALPLSPHDLCLHCHLQRCRHTPRAIEFHPLAIRSRRRSHTFRRRLHRRDVGRGARLRQSHYTHCSGAENRITHRQFRTCAPTSTGRVHFSLRPRRRLARGQSATHACCAERRSRLRGERLPRHRSSAARHRSLLLRARAAARKSVVQPTGAQFLPRLLHGLHTPRAPARTSLPRLHADARHLDWQRGGLHRSRRISPRTAHPLPPSR